MSSLNDDKITLFQSGIGDGKDLLLGFPSYEELLEDGQELFDINHRLKGFDSTKVITYYPLNNFLYMVKANYKIKKLSEFGLIDFRVDLLKPQNYKFKLIAKVMDTELYTKEWICEGTIDRDAQDYIVVEFDEEIFLPVNMSNENYSGTLPVQYEIENILGDDIIRVCFDDDTTLSSGFQFIKAKTFNHDFFAQMLLEENNFVASPATEYINFQRRQLNNIILRNWQYPDITSNLDIDYTCTEAIDGVLVEYGIDGHIASGMDFPYKYILIFNNPFIGDKRYEFQDFYHNLDAGSSEIIKNVSLAEFEKIPYNPDIHGPNDIKDFSYNVNLAPSIKILDPEFINKDIQFLSISPETNKINMNNVVEMNTFGLTKFSTLLEKEIIYEHINNNRLFRIFKIHNIRGNDPLFTTKCTLVYEVLDLATLNCLSSSVIDVSDDDDSLTTSNSRLTNDYIIEPRNIFIVKDRLYLVCERIVDFIHKFDNNEIDNTPYRYEIIQICINLFSGGFSKNVILQKEYSIEIANYEELVITSFVNSGKTKFIIIPSCRADIYFDKDNPTEFRVDVLFKQIQAHKATYDNNSVGGGTFPEQFCLYYCSENNVPTLIYSSTTEPLILDFGDSIGVCSSENNILFYYKTQQRISLADLGYKGIEVNLEDVSIKKIDFRYHNLLKVLNIRNQYLIIKNNYTNIGCIKMKIGLEADIILNHTILSNNDYISGVEKDLITDTIFNTRDNITDDYLNINEIIESTEFRYLNRNLILKDRFHMKYISANGKFISTKSKGDFLDFIINYNSTQIEIDEDKIVWFGTVNDFDSNGDIIVYSIRYEFMTTGFDSLITNTGIYFNLFTLMATPLFDLYYRELSTNIRRTLTGEEFKSDTDIIYESYVFDEIAFMFNKKQDIYIYFHSDIYQSEREEHITELTFTEYTIILPENGYLISTDILQMQSMIFWEKSPTISVRLLNDTDNTKTRKNIPVEQRVKTYLYRMTFYNFEGIIEKINVRYATRMPYDTGDLMLFDLINSIVDFAGSNITLNRLYARFSSSVQIVYGERKFQIIAHKIKDMDYIISLREQVVFFEDGGSDYYESELMLPLLSINGSEYEYFVENNAYTLIYMRDYFDGEDYFTIIPYFIMDNKLILNNIVPSKHYILDFTGNKKIEVEVNKRDVFDKYLDAREFDRPSYRNFELPYLPTNYTFDIQSSNSLVKTKGNNFFIIYFTNYEKRGEEKPKVLEAIKLGGHSNTYVYWKDNPVEIAKEINAYTRTSTDEILCIEAVEEEIVIDGEVYTKWFHNSVNGLDDNGNVVDTVMLSDEEYVFNFLTNQGKHDVSIRLSSTNIQDIVPAETVVSPVYSIIINNPKVQYDFMTPSADIGLTTSETRQIDAMINFHSDYNTKINLAEETFSIQRVFGGCIVTNSEGSRQFIIEIDNPLYTSFYYSDNNLATTIDTYMIHLESTSENIILSVDYIKTLLTIDPYADITNKTNEELWFIILSLSTEATINVFITAEILFPEQVAWNPDLNLGTYYLNNQEFQLLPNEEDNIFITNSDLITFATTPLPDEFSPIILINEVTGEEYTRVYFKDANNKFVTTKKQNIIFDDCYNGTLLNEGIDINSIEADEVINPQSISGVTLKLHDPIEPDKEVGIVYQLSNSFCVNIDPDKNKVIFTVHSIDEDAKFKVKYTKLNSIQSTMNVNPLTTINRGFAQLGGNN